jgi:hypothetical protein
MEMCGRARQATDDNTLRLMRSECWILKVPDAHSEYVFRIALHGNNICANAPQCDGVGTLPVLLYVCV